MSLKNKTIRIKEIINKISSIDFYYFYIITVYKK